MARPCLKVFAALTALRRDGLEWEVVELNRKFDRNGGKDGSIAITADYLETVIVLGDGHAFSLLHHLRSLSGRLALKLVSSPTQRAEALGLARTYLGHQEAFRDQPVVPLDAHLELYPRSERDRDPLGGEVSFKRTDLALFDLDAAERAIRCSLVEVKCLRLGGGKVQAHRQLRDGITAQVAQSKRVLRVRCPDPGRSAGGGRWGTGCGIGVCAGVCAC
jgi:hypothetical protein